MVPLPAFLIYMKNTIYYFFFLAIATVAACSPIQKVTIPPVTVSALKPGSNVYRGSYPRFYDIIHTKLDLQFNWDSCLVIGKAQIQARPWFQPSDSIVLDAKGFTVNNVTLVHGHDHVPLKYTYTNYKLSIKLDRVYTNKEKYTVAIDYVAHPEKLEIGKDIASAGDRGFYFVNADGKNPEYPKEFWTQGESECNSSWFPTINDPQEKMTQEINMTVPERMVTLSNGVLDFSSENGDGTRTDTWVQEKPHATYLTMVAAGDFKIVKDTWRDREVSYYMEPKFAENARLIFGKTPEMLEFFSNVLNYEFPWDKYSQLVARNFYGGAMENTTASVFFDGMNLTKEQYQDESNEDIISHELFHHWFGDLVTAESWANLPLNESFATYGEYLWNEHKYGRDFADRAGWHDEQRYMLSEKARDLHVIRYDYADKEQMFDEVSYQKGGRILHMLRKFVGDEAFFKSLNLYLNRYAYKAAEIGNLRQCFEEVMGVDMNWFFNEWFLACGHPVLNMQSHYDSQTHKVIINIRQEQDLSKYPLYRLPIAVDIYAGGKVERKLIELNNQQQEFAFDVAYAPDLVNIDAEKCLLAEKKENKTLAQYIFQYNHGPLFMDRLEALNYCETHSSDSLSRTTMMAALSDKNWEIRRKALGFVSKLNREEKSAVYEQVKAMALKDDRSYVRAEAIVILRTVFRDNDNSSTLAAAKQDTAPSVQAALR